MTELSKEDLIHNKVGYMEELEILAEECTELAHAALKASRYLRGTNPTPLDWDEIRAALREEWADVYLCTNVINRNERDRRIHFDEEMYQYKLDRWLTRLGDISEDE